MNLKSSRPCRRRPLPRPIAPSKVNQLILPQRRIQRPLLPAIRIRNCKMTRIRRIAPPHPQLRRLIRPTPRPRKLHALQLRRRQNPPQLIHPTIQIMRQPIQVPIRTPLDDHQPPLPTGCLQFMHKQRHRPKHPRRPDPHLHHRHHRPPRLKPPLAPRPKINRPHRLPRRHIIPAPPRKRRRPPQVPLKQHPLRRRLIPQTLPCQYNSFPCLQTPAPSASPPAPTSQPPPRLPRGGHFSAATPVPSVHILVV